MNELQTNPHGTNGRPTQARLVPQSARRARGARSLRPARQPYGAGPDDGGAGLGADLREYWRILNKRKWVIVSVIARAVLALGAVRTLMETPLYTATVRLQIDRNVAKIVEGGNVTPIEGSDFEFLRHAVRAPAEPHHGRARGLRR